MTTNRDIKNIIKKPINSIKPIKSQENIQDFKQLQSNSVIQFKFPLINFKYLTPKPISGDKQQDDSDYPVFLLTNE